VNGARVDENFADLLMKLLARENVKKHQKEREYCPQNNE